MRVGFLITCCKKFKIGPTSCVAPMCKTNNCFCHWKGRVTHSGAHKTYFLNWIKWLGWILSPPHPTYTCAHIVCTYTLVITIVWAYWSFIHNNHLLVYTRYHRGTSQSPPPPLPSLHWNMSLSSITKFGESCLQSTFILQDAICKMIVLITKNLRSCLFKFNKWFLPMRNFRKLMQIYYWNLAHVYSIGSCKIHHGSSDRHIIPIHYNNSKGPQTMSDISWIYQTSKLNPSLRCVIEL